MSTPRRRTALALLAALAVLAPLVWLWQRSLVPNTYSVMDMGYVDSGGGPTTAHSGHGIDVATLTGDRQRRPDVEVTLTARAERFTLPSREAVEGYTLNGSSPGPTLRVVEGQLLQVTLVNDNVSDGVTLHWHGVDVPNAEDGVAGITQDAVPPGGRWTYRFVAEDPGTYWYHSHQMSHEQVQRGLLGALVIQPRQVGLMPRSTQREAVALMHVYDGRLTVNGRTTGDTVAAAPGEKVRVRVINTDNGSTRVWASGSAYRLLAVDGRDLHGPTEVRDRSVVVTAGGRADLEVTAPARVELGGVTAVVVGEDVTTQTAAPEQTLDLLTYGTPAARGLDPDKADRRFRYDVGRRPGFLDGRPGMWWSINGHLFPDVPMFHVREGDTVVMTIKNDSGETHPMHLHGHHAVVLSRNGVQSTGSPWWVDSLDVPNGESFDIAFRADNPGIWVDHCHNLPHAVEGLIAHLVYEGVTTRLTVGGEADNHPE